MTRFRVIPQSALVAMLLAAALPAPGFGQQNASNNRVEVYAAVHDAGDRAKKTKQTAQWVRDTDIEVELSDMYVNLTANSPQNAIGITIAPTDAVLRSQLGLKKSSYGVVVTGVIEKSPAARAGVKQHDIILSATGTGIAAGSDLASVIRKAGKKPLQLKLLRGGKRITVHIKPAPTTNVARLKSDMMAFTFYGSGFKYMIGITTKDASPELIAQLVLPPATGRVVTGVTPKSPAEQAGLQKLDVLLKVNDTYVKSSQDLSKAIDVAGGKPVKLEFIRAGRKQTCTVKPVKRSPSTRYYPLIDVYNQELNLINLHRHRGIYQLNSIPHSQGTNQLKYEWRIGFARTVDSQMETMSRQIKTLEASLNRLKATLASMKKSAKAQPAKKQK